MSTAEAFLATPAESHNRHETPSPLASGTNHESLGGDGISQEEVDAAWMALAQARKELFATPPGRMVVAMEDRWMLMERLKKNAACGCSRSTAPCGQADHLRRVVAGGVRQISSETH